MGEEDQEDSGEEGGDCHCAFSSDVRDVDGPAGDYGAWNADDGGYGIVAVGLGDACAASAAGLGEVLGEEGVEKWVTHSNCRPNEPDQNCADSKSLAVEERSDAFAAEFRELAFDYLASRELGVVDVFWMSADSVQDIFCQPGLGAIEVRDSMDDSYCFSLAATRKQELWRFEEVEEEEAADEHHEGDRAESEDEVSPAPVVWIVGNECPSQEGGDELPNRPPDREQSEEISAREGQELQEQRAIDRKIAPNSETDACV